PQARSERTAPVSEAERDPASPHARGADRTGEPASMTGLALAAIVLIEVGSGRVLRQDGDVTRRVAPGSTIKPFVLQATTLRPERVCGRTLRLAGRRMDCVHPKLAMPLTAREAIAYSCNYYF